MVAEVEVGVKAPIVLEMLRASLERLRVKVREVVVEEVAEVVEVVGSMFKALEEEAVVGAVEFAIKVMDLE